MKFCSKCGKEIMDDAVICVNCGCSVEDVKKQKVAVTPQTNTGEKSTLATCALVFAFLIPIVGLILGIIGVVKYKNSAYKNRCIAAIIVSVVVWILTVVIYVVSATSVSSHSYYSYY